MIEETGRGENAGAAAPETSSLAMDLAMEEARADPSLRGDVAAFLRDQRSLIDVQKNHLVWQFALGQWEKRLGVMLRAATMVIGCLFAGAVGYMMWDASRANGLRVASFSVPPDLAARGMTGEVVAARVIDRLSQLQAQTNTARPARSYSNAWGDKTIKLEIAETGISLTELDNWLRGKLGNETLLSGEIVRTQDGVTVTARAGENGAETVSGPDADMDVLVGRLAEAIYRLTQPYRYATWLLRHENRAADALPIFKDLALNGSPDDRLWSYNMWGQAERVLTGDTEAALRLYQQANAADPEAIGVYTNLAGSLSALGRHEEGLQAAREWMVRLGGGKQRYIPAAQIPAAKRRVQATIDTNMGAYHDALPVAAENLKTGLPGFGVTNLLGAVIQAQTGEHDLSAARGTLADYPPGTAADRFALQIAFAAEDWKSALGMGDARTAYLKANPHDRRYALVTYAPPLALAQAQLGDFAAATRSIAPTPADCYPCLIARARIAELRGQQARADFWFTRATDAGPSLPFAFAEQGKVLLTRGKPDEAIARFTIASQKSPHFADAIEGWGEALMAKNQSHLALAKFAEAEKYAPNWGRLHLKWGHALLYTGKPEEAKAKFAHAAQLDLTPAEKAELARQPASIR